MAVVPCNVTWSSRPPVKLQFHRDLRPLPTLSAKDYLTLSSGRLLIGAVRSRDAGRYRCSGYNDVIGARVWSPAAYQLHIVDERNVSAPSFIWFSSESVSVLLGQNMSLECVAHGVPAPQIVWEKYGGQLPSGRYSLLLGQLFIGNVKKHDAGTYLCTASNGIGRQQTKQGWQLLPTCGFNHG